jgi:hypothetical protein
MAQRAIIGIALSLMIPMATSFVERRYKKAQREIDQTIAAS